MPFVRKTTTPDKNANNQNYRHHHLISQIYISHIDYIISDISPPNNVDN